MLERIHVPGLWRRAIPRSSLEAQKKDEDDQDTGSFLFLVQRASTDGLCRVVGWQNWFSQIPALGLHCNYTNILYSWDKYILLLESPCSSVRPLVRYRKISHHRYMHHTYTHASGSRIEDHRYVHHTHIDQSQGSRIIDMCIIHTCSIVKDRGT